MAEATNIYYRSLLNVLNVVENCRRLRKDLRENEYEQAFALLDYNSQCAKLAPISEETKGRLLKAAKDADTRDNLRRVVKKAMPKKKVSSVEEILKVVGV